MVSLYRAAQPNFLCRSGWSSLVAILGLYFPSARITASIPVHSDGFHKDIFVQLYHNLDHIHLLKHSPFSPDTPVLPPQSCFYFHVVCVCLRFVSFLPAALFLVSTVMASFEAAQSFCFCFLELRHTWSYHILTAALIGEM